MVEREGISEDTLLGGKVRLLQPMAGHRAGTDAVLAAALAGLLAAGMPGPTVVEYDFTDGARAFADLESRSVVGKAVLRLR